MKTELKKAYEAGRCGYDFEDWYKNYAKSKKDLSYSVLNYLYKAKSKALPNSKPFKVTVSRRRLIKKRVNDGHSMPQFMGVIDFKIRDWKNTDYQKHLIPETLFSDKFDKYLDQARDNYANKEHDPYRT